MTSPTFVIEMTGAEFTNALKNGPHPVPLAVQALGYNAEALTDRDIDLILTGTEGVAVNVHDQRKSNRYRVVVNVGVRDAEGGLWLARDPQVFYVTPSRNFGPAEIARHYATEVAPGLPII